MENLHIPSVYKNSTNYSYEYGKWLQGYEWTYIMTIRRHFAITETACLRYAESLMNYSNSIKTLWMALEHDRSDHMNHLHVLMETEEIAFTSKMAINALGLKRHPKALSYFSPVKSNQAVAMYCSKHISTNIIYHDFYSQEFNTTSDEK